MTISKKKNQIAVELSSDASNFLLKDNFYKGVYISLKLEKNSQQLVLNHIAVVIIFSSKHIKHLT